MIANLYKHIDKELIPHTGAGTMCLYMKNKLHELVDVPIGVVQLDDEHPAAALQLILGFENSSMNVFFKADGTITQLVIDQGEIAPTAIFVPNDKYPEQINENFIMVMALGLFPRKGCNEI